MSEFGPCELDGFLYLEEALLEVLGGEDLSGMLYVWEMRFGEFSQLDLVSI
jgi:hypothetical protein